MQPGSEPARSLAQVVAVVAGAAVTATLLAEAAARFGPVVFVLPLAGVVAWYLLLHPGVALGALVGTTLAFEGGGPDRSLFGIATDRWYQYVGPVQPTDVLLALLAGAVALGIARPTDEHPVALRSLGPFTGPVLLLAVAVVFGTVAGQAAGADRIDMANAIKPLLYLVLLPFLVVAVLVEGRQRQQVVRLLGAAVIVKSAIGLAALATGQAISFEEDGALTYLDAPVNHLGVVYLASVAAMPLAKLKVPTWALVGTPVVALSLLLSFRRSFWIAALLALVLTAIVASGQRGRPWIAIAGAALALALWATLAGGGGSTSNNEIVQRAQSLNPEELQQTSGDRYRLDEQRNVVEELRRHPLTGIGLGVPWTARSPLSEEHLGGRQYTHVVALYYWLRLGPLGLAAYLWLSLTTAWVGIQVWRRSRAATERIVALALSAATVGLMLVELTASFTGISVRVTVLVALTIGWLASAREDLTDVQGVAAPVQSRPLDQLAPAATRS